MRLSAPALLMFVCVCLAVPLSGCAVPGPNGPADSFGIDFSLPPGSQTRGAIVFMVDGLNAEIFQQMLDAGELPAIKKYFVDRGLYAPRAVTGVPSVTLASETTYVTGNFPGHHQIVSITWFDRNTLIWRSYATIAQKNFLDEEYTRPNIYEQFPDRTTFSMFFQPHRQSTQFFENWHTAGPPFLFEWYDFIDRLTLYRVQQAMDVARVRHEFPAVMYVYMLSPDFHAYKYGSSSSEYRQSIRHTDYQIGRLLGDLQRAGLLDKVNLALVSDHGHTDVNQHFPVEKFLGDMGLELATEKLWDKTPFEHRLKTYQTYSAVGAGAGDRYWGLSLRKPIRRDDGTHAWESWLVRPSPEDLSDFPVERPGGLFKKGISGRIDLLKVLTSQGGIDAVAYSAGPNKVRVLRSKGEVELTQEGGPGADISYRVTSGDDPLEYRGKVADDVLAGKAISPRAWLEQTCDTQFPDLPAQILAYFRCRRAGDIAIFAAPGYDLSDSLNSGHGGIRPGDMHIPLLLAGPGVPHKTLDVARGADLVPTLLHLLGRPIPAGMDGQNLIEP